MEMRADLLRAVMVSCKYGAEEALEEIVGQVNYLRDLMEVGDFRVTDVADCCMSLGLTDDYAGMIAKMIYN